MKGTGGPAATRAFQLLRLCPPSSIFGVRGEVPREGDRKCIKQINKGNKVITLFIYLLFSFFVFPFSPSFLFSISPSYTFTDSPHPLLLCL
jgi:hypothetical protein